MVASPSFIENYYVMKVDFVLLFFNNPLVTATVFGQMSTGCIDLFFNNVTSHLRSVTTQTSCVKHQWWNFSRPGIMPSTSPKMLLYHVSAYVKLLHANVVGHTAVLSDALSFGNPIPSLTCRRLAPRLTSDVSLSRYSCFSHCRMTQICLS